VFGCACYPNLSIKAAHKLAPGPPDVLSSDTPLITKFIGVLISPPTTSSSPDMLFFMRQISPSLPHPAPLLHRLLHRLQPPPCSLYDFGCTPCGALNSTRTTRGPGVYDYGRTTRGCGALPVPLLAPPLGYARVTDTASTSAVTASEGRTGGISGQSSSDDHSGEAGFLASGRQTHPIGHLGVNLVVSTLLRPRCPSRSELVPRHRRRVCCLDWQQHMGSCPSPCCLQRHRQIDFQSQVQLRWLFGVVHVTPRVSNPHDYVNHMFKRL
jgi:hypothetical protein